MNDFEKVIAVLNQLNISYELVEHEPALSTEQADSWTNVK
ncbi:FIG042921: similarity to aminoacyl-tRNA editing enzymes YbaK, ProX [Streptococcus agalactiae ILRI005]|nr:FIG042921: similarity to aminoacyl-tRNA editing enzymes YbaK, ProX [Streptococcus agalactiae ILRI005]